MSTENPTHWVKKSDRARAIEPLLLARRINDDWLESNVQVTHYQFTGDLRQALMDLLDVSSRKTKAGTNLPTISLRLMLQTCLQDVLSVDRHLGCRSGDKDYGNTYAVSALGPAEDKGCDMVARIVHEWAMSSLEPWSMDKGCTDIAVRVKGAAVAANISATSSHSPLRDERSGTVKFSLVARLLAEQMRGQELFEGLGPCELVLPGPFDDTSFDLISAPRTLAAPGQGGHTFSMLARIQVSTMPGSPAAYVSVSPSKRVWADAMPNGGNTGRKATAYAFPPHDGNLDGIRAIIPITVDKGAAAQEYRWELNGDEYAVIQEQARLSRTEAPADLATGISESAQDKSRWWIGLPQTTRLYKRVNQHTPSDTDEVELMRRSASLLEGFADGEISFELRNLPLNKSSTTAMVKAEDCGTVGAALLEVDAEAEEDDEDETGDLNEAKNEAKLAVFREQCQRVLNKVHAGARPTLWLLGGTPDEVNMSEQIVRHLFGESVTFKRDPIPEDVHGLQQKLPGAGQATKLRFNLRVEKWKDAQNPAGLLKTIAAHQGPKFVLVCAPKEIERKQEDSVNRRAAIHAICSQTGAGVHHVLPMESGNTPARMARARQNFIHRLQSAMTDVMLAHSGHVIDVAAFAKDRIPKGCKGIYGIQALRKNAQMYSGETPVSMLIYSRINLSNDTTEVQFHYGSAQRLMCSRWMPLAEGLVWLAGQRDITSDERWLKTNFEAQTRKFLNETHEADPQAVVMLDWGTLAGLWKNLTDENLKNAPALGHTPLKLAFPQMSFVRIRYGVNSKINVRGQSTTYYEAIRYEGATMVHTGNVIRDEYATTTKRLIEITENSAVGSYRPTHFIGMMTPRKTSQGKRGLSSFRAVTLMNKVGKEKGNNKDVIFERGVRPALSKDNSSPGPIDISVLQHGDGVTAQDVAVLCMGLRLGYPHYDEWTQLPAPLFFIRKIDDYIIKYPFEAEADTVTPVSAESIPVPDLDSDDAEAVIPAFAVVSQMVQHALKFDTDSGEAPAVPINTEQPEDHGSVEDSPRHPLGGAATAIPDLDLAVNAEGKHDPALLLQLAKSIPYSALVPFDVPDGLRKRKFFKSMIRGDISVTVEVPYFVDLRTIFSSYPKPDKATVNKTWRELRESGHVRQSGQAQPSDFAEWLAKKMVHPQGAYIINARRLFGNAFIIPQLEAIVSRHNGQTEEADEKVFAQADGLDLSPIVDIACAEQDDEALGWLVFSAAQCPGYGIGSSVMKSLTSAPGPRTLAALAYYVQCAKALQEGLGQVGSGHNTFQGVFSSIQLKRPKEFATQPVNVLTSIARAIQTASFPSQKPQFLAQEDADVPSTTSPEPVNAKSEQPVSRPTATEPSSPVMKIKTQIAQLLADLNPGQDTFTDEIQQIRSLLTDLEQIDGLQKDDAVRAQEVIKLCEQAGAKAQALLDRIMAIDPENIVQANTLRPAVIAQDLLESVQKELASIEDAVLAAEKVNESLLHQFHLLKNEVPEADRRRHARVISGLDIQLEGQLQAIQSLVSGSKCYVAANPDDPDGGQAMTADQVKEADPATPKTMAATEAAQAADAVPEQVLAPISPAEPASTGELPATPAVAASVPQEISLAATVEENAAPQAFVQISPEKADDEVQASEDKATEATETPHNAPIQISAAQTAEAEKPALVPAQATFVGCSMKESVKDATAGENTELERALAKLQKLMGMRHFGLAGVYIDAIETTFGEQKEIGLNYALLQALTLELDSVDCNSMVQPKFNEWQTRAFMEIAVAGCDGIPQAIGMLGAGLSSAIFYDPGHGHDDPLWSVLGPVQAILQNQPSIAELITHIASREKKAVTLSQNKLIMSLASSEDRIAAKLADYRDRARKWVNDPSMHTKFAHAGFGRAHEHIYSTESAVGKCLAMVAKDDVKALKQALKDNYGKFRKPKATVEEAFRKIRDRTELNGTYLVHAVNNLEVTESFLTDYIELSEKKIDNGVLHALRPNEREFIKTLHARLRDAVLEIDEIFNNGKAWTNLESICLQSGRDLIRAVLRMFDDSKVDACIPQEIQRLLVQQPMGRDLLPSLHADPSCNKRALMQGDALIESINALVQDDLSAHTHPIATDVMDELLLSAQSAHIANNRFLPAWRIDALLGRPKSRGAAGDETPSLLNQFSQASTDLQRKLQELRQRVTHAMALSALSQKDAGNMLYTIGAIESVLKQGHLGKPECRSVAYPDFPHAYFDINESITKVLDSRMQEATERLRANLQGLRELKGSTINKDVDRVARMLSTQRPADLRAAHDAIRLLEAGQELPVHSPQRTQETPKQFEELVEAVNKIQRPKEQMLESLCHLLEQAPTGTDPAFIAHLSSEQRAEAATFIRHWIKLCTLRGGDAAEMVSEVFQGLGLGVPHYAAESTSRSVPVRLEFPPHPFASLSSDCFIPPQLGSQQNALPVYAISGNRPENEIETIIQNLSSNPVLIMARTSMALTKRMRTVSRGASVILIEDYLIAFMALHPGTRAQKMLEIGLLNFQSNPYSAEGAHVAREMFFGRQAELSALRGVKNAAILYGGRRLGKSSLLAQIERDENRPQSGRRALYIPMNKDYSGSDHVLFAWRSIYEHLVTHQIIGQMPTQADAAQAYADWIESGLVSSSTRHCYLLLDEADELMAAELELAHGRPGFIRSLQNVSESLAPRGFTLRYCIAGLHNLARMTTEVNSALGKAETIALEPFTTAEDIMRGIELITRPMAAAGFYFNAESGDLPLRIMSVCNFYPAFIQIYCQKLLLVMQNTRSSRGPYCFITLEDIERVESNHDLLADLSKKFSMTLDLDTRYKAIALVLADFYYTEIETGVNDGATMQKIREHCDVFVSNHFKNINTSAFESLLDEMRKLNVLEKSGNRYRLRNPSIAMLLGDKERVESQIQDLASLPPSRSLKHGEKRISLQPNAHTRSTGEPLPYFPMPISWIHAQIVGKRASDGSLPILCGNGQSGLRQISPPKLAAKLTQTDDFYCNPVSHMEMSTFLRTKVCTNLIPASGNLFLMSASAAWKTSEIASFSGSATRIASTSRINLALAALPPRIWEMVSHLKEQHQKGVASSLSKWNIVPIPPYSIDAIQFHLGDNRAVADSKQACDDILYATCGFGRLVQKHCNESLTVEKAASLKAEALATFASSLASFYEAIAMPVDLISPIKLRHLEAGLLLIEGETRTDTNLEYINDLIRDNFVGEPELDKFDFLFLQWMGLLQEAPDNKWHVPPLYCDLLRANQKE